MLAMEKTVKECVIGGCGKTVLARGWCRLHYARWYNYGTTDLIDMRGCPVKHGMSHSSEYRTWSFMIQRCSNPKVLGYKNYGGRGITVCSRWLTFANFYADMGKRPSGLTLERINNDGNYEPSNCKWATYSEQNRNKRYLGRKQYKKEGKR